jgi:predicted nucleic acid-binding protein
MNVYALCYHFVSIQCMSTIVIRDLFAISAHDARFLVVAQSLGALLVTEDRKLRRAAPALTQSLEDANV